MNEFDNLTLIRTDYDSCPRRGNLEIQYLEDDQGNETIYTVNQDGEEWVE